MTVNGTAVQPAASWQLLWRTEARRVPWRKVVLDLGSNILGDEDLGMRVLPYLKAELGPRSPVEWIDGRALDLNLMPLVEQCSHLLVVDAVDAGRPPGALIDLSLLGLLRPNGHRLSQQQEAFHDALELALVLEQAPANFRLIGLQPALSTAGAAVSNPVTTALPALCERAAAVLDGWGLLV
jgi:hydrogenase maturation protease